MRRRPTLSRVSQLFLPWLFFAVLAQAAAVVPASEMQSTGVSGSAPARDSVLEQIHKDAAVLIPHLRAAWVHRFLLATSELPPIEPRTVYHDSTRTRYWTATEAAALPDSEKSKLVQRRLDEEFYYTTRYGSPLAYSRLFQILAEAGLDDVAGKKIVDFGYGTIGHLRLLASLGADVTGIEVDPLLRALYSAPGDQGTIRGAGGREGRLRVLDGHFPAEPEVTTAVGEGYDLFISKNTLKNGYIHPEQPVDPRRLVHLGVGDTAFVRAIHRILKPGGRATIYNLCPAPNAPGKPYIPWADGRCPFPAALWSSEGFRVIAFDRDDTRAARGMGHALGWDRGESPMDLEKDLFGSYTLVEKPQK